MPADITNVIDDMATTALGLISSVVTNYWPLILGLVVLGAIAYRLRGVFNVAK